MQLQGHSLSGRTASRCPLTGQKGSTGALDARGSCDRPSCGPGLSTPPRAARALGSCPLAWLKEIFIRLLPAETLGNACRIVSKLHFVTPTRQVLCDPLGHTVFAGRGQATHLAYNLVKKRNPHTTITTNNLSSAASEEDFCPVSLRGRSFYGSKSQF